MEIITANNLVRTYKKGPHSIAALNNLNFSINTGNFVSIVGKSGSGKSTLLNIICGLDSAASGQIIVEGKNLLKLSKNELAQYRRFTVGMVFQSFNLIPSQTAVENVIMALIFSNYPKAKRKERAAELLYSLGLENRMTHKPSELSGGEAQRVAIARALANNPKIILADEPTGNLDTTTSDEILTLLKNLNKDKGITIIMVTHDKDTALDISDNTLILSDGKIIENIKKTNI